jgi:6,7-dimethyl-8-ribityllumazine synthase
VVLLCVPDVSVWLVSSFHHRGTRWYTEEIHRVRADFTDKAISPQKHRNAETSAEAKIRKKTLAGKLDASGLRFGIVVSRFNEFITDRLLRSAYDGLARSGARENDIEIVRVPGSFEIPSAARTLAETKKYDAIICLGCLIRGDTAHYDVIVNEVTRGIGQSAQETGVPHAFGVLTCENLEQAIDRAGLKMGNKGFEAALAAVEMANLNSAISREPSAKKAVSRQPSAISKTKTKTRARASSSSKQRK